MDPSELLHIYHILNLSHFNTHLLNLKLVGVLSLDSLIIVSYEWES